MIRLPKTLSAWGSDTFDETFKAETEALPADTLPLQQGLSLSSYVSGEPFRVMVISKEAEEDVLRIKAGVFYSGIIAGCSCADDPTPTDVQAEYCDMAFLIDRHSAEVQVSLLAD